MSLSDEYERFFDSIGGDPFKKKNGVVRDTKQYGACQDCGTRRLVGTVEWNRAAPPRCRKCGGSIGKCVDKRSKSNQIRDEQLAAFKERKDELKKSRDED